MIRPVSISITRSAGFSLEAMTDSPVSVRTGSDSPQALSANSIAHDPTRTRTGGMKVTIAATIDILRQMIGTRLKARDIDFRSQLTSDDANTAGVFRSGSVDTAR